MEEFVVTSVLTFVLALIISGNFYRAMEVCILETVMYVLMKKVGKL